MTVYNKLVRDKIPQLIRQQGEEPNVRILDDEEYARCLADKLDEEVAEFHRDRNIEELEDSLEVVIALTESVGASTEELMEVYHRKHQERGGFADRAFLISKEDRCL